MATLTTTDIQAFAHCPDARCAGTKQQPVPAVRHTAEWTYVENGGNMPGIERSSAVLAFVSESTDASCPDCGKPRELSEQERPFYTPLSGHRQDGLLHVKSFDASQAPPSGNDAVIAQLMAQVAQLSAQIAGQAAPTGFAKAAAVEGERVEADLRKQEARPPLVAPEPEPEPSPQTVEEYRAREIKQRRLDALAKARAARSAKAAAAKADDAA